MIKKLTGRNRKAGNCAGSAKANAGAEPAAETGTVTDKGKMAVCLALSLLLTVSVLMAGCAKADKSGRNEGVHTGELNSDNSEGAGGITPDNIENEAESDRTEDPGTDGKTGEKDEIGGETFVGVNETVYITADRVNLRMEPSYDGTVLRKADAGETFTRTGKGEGDWDRITDDSGAVYYAAGLYLSRYNPLAAAFTYRMSGLSTVDVSKQRYTYEEMKEDLEELAESYPDHMKLSTIGETRDGREIYLARLGSQDAENAVIIQAAIHAREYMTVLIAMKQLEYYLEYYDTGHYRGIPYADIFDKAAVYLIPMMNPDGIAVSQSGLEAIRSDEVKNDIREWYERDSADGKTGYSFENYMKYFKANSYGVDLNRNFDMGWKEFGGSKAPGAEKYKGTAPGSEPESAALIDLTEELHPGAVISYHASGSVLYWDYGQTGGFRRECEALAKEIARLTGYQMMDKGNDGGVDAAGYSDWAAGVKQIPAVTIEIGTGKAPLGIEEFQTIWDKNREVFAAAAAQYLED